MGWSADAIVDGQLTWYVNGPHGTPVMREAFKLAMGDAQRLSGKPIDSQLNDGGLHLSNCEAMFEKLGGVKLRGKVWTPAEVRIFQERTRWPDPAAIDKEEIGAYWSVRKFVETCAEFGLGIEFMI